MKITDRFIGDHKTFRKLIGDINSIAGQPTDQWDRKKLLRWVELFKDHLILHAWGEETFYYPAVRVRLSEDSPVINRSYVDRLDVEHDDVDRLMDQLEAEVRENPLSVNWPITYQSFVDGLTAHMGKEEAELFPFSEGLLGSEGLDRLSAELERRRREAPPIRRHSTI